MFYCPSRRNSLGNNVKFSHNKYLDTDAPVRIFSPPGLKGGGTDYAACAGSGILFNDISRSLWDLTGSQLQLANTGTTYNYNQRGANIGMFYSNSSVRMGDLKDGSTQTIMVGEAERFETLKLLPQNRSIYQIASDGWAWGGPATLFSTFDGPNKRLNYAFAGSPHDDVCLVGLADGSGAPGDTKYWTEYLAGTGKYLQRDSRPELLILRGLGELACRPHWVRSTDHR